MNKKETKELLLKFTFVMWDRFIDLGNILQFYGWMERGDRYKDFIVLCIDKNTGNTGYTNSSEKNASKIRKILKIKKSGTSQCQRVEHHYGVKNSIKLTKNNKIN